ncbi:MAG: hypothetical protein JSR67_11090 [Proteobacteria bacterium]|nr:hypothetical protein [Pseudomonadota bacterium]
MSGFICLLLDWQDLIGAFVGGTLGIVGAFIVATSVGRRERRAASRMLQGTLLGVTGAVYAITYHRKITLATFGSEQLAETLSFFRPQVPPTFEAQMAALIDKDTSLGAMLAGFQHAYRAVEYHMAHIERANNPAEPNARRARAVLPETLQAADDYANAALYLLALQEVGAVRRWFIRLRRWLAPSQHDMNMAALVDRMLKPADKDAAERDASTQ